MFRYLCLLPLLLLGCRKDDTKFGVADRIPIKQVQAPAGDGVPTTTSSLWNANATTCTNAQVALCNGTALTFATMSGSCTITNAGVVTCTSVNPSTSLTATMTQPAVGSTFVSTVSSNTGMFVNEFLYVEGGGYYQVTATSGSTSATLRNVGDNVNAAVDAGVADGSVVSAAGRPRILKTASSTGTGSVTCNSSYQAMTGLTVPAVTLYTGTSVTVNMDLNAFPSTNAFAFMTVVVSGATTIAAADANGAVSAQSSGGTYFDTVRSAYHLTGLTAGTNTFTASYRCGASGTMTVTNTDLAVQTD